MNAKRQPRHESMLSDYVAMLLVFGGLGSGVFGLYWFSKAMDPRAQLDSSR